MALGLAEAGVIDRRTMRAFDAMCPTPVEGATPGEIRRIRLREWASLPSSIVTPGPMTRWEHGKERLRGTSLKLLDLIARKSSHAIA